MINGIAPLVIVGPPGIGKSWLVRHLAQQHPVQVVPVVTTRPLRPGESPAEIRHLPPKEFSRIETAGQFVLTSTHYGNRYGGTFQDIKGIHHDGKVPAALIYAPVVPQFLSHFPGSYLVFLWPRSTEFLFQRMCLRGDTPHQIQQRLANIHKEWAAYRQLQGRYDLAVEIGNDTDICFVVKAIASHFGFRSTSGG